MAKKKANWIIGLDIGSVQREILKDVGGTMADSLVETDKRIVEACLSRLGYDVSIGIYIKDNRNEPKV